ncbi:hypothetical protein GGI21_005396, partial [Coemansia aciculifera]
MFRVALAATSSACRRAQPLSAMAKRLFANSSLHSLSEDEEMMRDAVSKFARSVVQPHVASMDDAESMEP